jgi:D-alanine-D-alanine ligase
MGMKVAVLVGGRSGEHDVSLVTGQAVDESLARLGHERWILTLERDGSAHWPDQRGNLADGLSALVTWGPDVAFIAMHGPDGEDGTIQGVLELLGIPYQGSTVASSAVTMHKARTKAVYRQAGLAVARDWTITGEGVDWAQVSQQLGLPLVLKTSLSGSSVGVEVVGDLESLASRGEALLAETDALVVEEWLAGREFTSAVLEDDDRRAHALPSVEIIPRGDGWFDYATKYDPEAVDEICPSDISPALEEELGRLALVAHQVLGCRDYSRTDFILDDKGRPRLLETNTLPGLTPASLFPKAAAAAGMDFDALVERLVSLAARR